jgi:hypothetical protein
VRNLEKRLEKLEQEYTPAEPLVVVLDFKLSDRVLGMSLGDVPTEEFFVTPMEGECEQEFYHRGTELAKQYVRSHPRMAQDHICVKVHRYYEPHKKPEPVPEPVVAQPTVKPKESLSNPAPQPPRVMTIKEVEGQYADRPHWMG